MPNTLSALPQSFIAKKKHILDQLSIPEAEYTDLSPKGSIDIAIRGLIDEINAREGCVTTSSCSGRISIFLEGKKTSSTGEEDLNDGEREMVKSAGIGGKGGGGKWLFVTHDPIAVDQIDVHKELGMESYDSGQSQISRCMKDKNSRLIHLKFEPMILHVLTASLSQAQIILSAALQAGFRESGALNLTSSSTESAIPIVGIRSMGLAFESVVGIESDGRLLSMIPDEQLRYLLEVANQRFVENSKRIERFRSLLIDTVGVTKSLSKKGDHDDEWEDAAARRDRKRADGIRLAESLKKSKQENRPQEQDESLEISTLGL